MENGNVRLKRPFVLASIMLAMFLSAIEATIVATAMPSIVADLQQFSLYSWVFSAYLLTSSVTVLLFGKLADIYGRKPIFILGIIIFLCGSTLAGSSHSMAFLIFSRLIQGVGAGALMPVATTIIGDIYSKEERGKVQGYLSAVWGISAIIGPMIGSFFVEFLHWRYVFWMNIPLGIIALIGILLFFEETIQKQRQSVDYTSFIMMMCALTAFMYLLVESNRLLSWDSWQMYILITIIMMTSVLFYLRQRQMSEPILPVQLWRVRLILIANITSLLTGAVMISISSYLPTFVQAVMDKSALIAGFTLTTMSISWPLASTVSGIILFKVGFRKISIIGGICLVIGSAMFVFLHVYPSLIIAASASFFVGVGMGMTSTAFIVSIQTTVSWKVRGIATAMNMFMRSIGSAIGVAFLGGILNYYLTVKLSDISIDGEPLHIDMIDQLLQTTELNEMSAEVLSVLKLTLSSSLQIIYATVCIVAIMALFFILLLPRQKDSI